MKRFPEEQASQEIWALVAELGQIDVCMGGSLMRRSHVFGLSAHEWAQTLGG